MVAVLFGLAATRVAAQGFVFNKTDGTKLYLKDSEVKSIELYEAGEIWAQRPRHSLSWATARR